MALCLSGAMMASVQECTLNIMDQKHQGIEDPDTGQVLGSVERPKARVKITVIQAKLSLATHKKTRVNVGGRGGLATLQGGLAHALMPPKWVTKYETLKTVEKTWEDLDEKESFVKIGDPVVEALVTEEEDSEEGLVLSTSDC